MKTVHVLLNLLLSLALVAGSVWPDQASGAHEHAAAPVAAAPPPCHGDSEAPVPPDVAVDADCCVGGDDCSCDCLHHAPVVMVLVRSTPYLFPARLADAVIRDTAPSPALPPTLRPPIA